MKRSVRAATKRRRPRRRAAGRRSLYRSAELAAIRETGPDAGRRGLVVASDAAGDVVAVGSDVKDVRPGDRVTSLYFKKPRSTPQRGLRL